MDDDQQFCLRWNNHQSTLISVFDTLLENETLVDCTLAAEGKFLKAHKVVLSACSPYFATLLQEQYDKHPIFILKDVKYQELRAMMDYMYRGEVNISQDQLAALLKAAESLQIKGLSDNRSSSGGGPKHDPPQQQQQQQLQHRGLGLPGIGGGLGLGGISGKHGAGSGYTLEQTKRARLGPASIDSQDHSGSREGSSSPTSRRRRKLRRRSIDNTMSDVHHENSNSSQIQSIATTSSLLQQQPNSGLGNVGAIAAAASALASHVPPSVAAVLPTTAVAAASNMAGISTAVQSAAAQQQMTVGVPAGPTTSATKKTENVKGSSGVGGSSTDVMHSELLASIEEQQQEQQQQSAGLVELKTEKQNHKQQKSVLGKDVSATTGSSVTSTELVIEPKSEYDEEGNEENVEDLTLDDEDMGMEDLDHNAGTSHGNEGSSQGYAQWQHDRSQDEVFMATQEAQQRDPQDSTDGTSISFSDFRRGCEKPAVENLKQFSQVFQSKQSENIPTQSTATKTIASATATAKATIATVVTEVTTKTMTKVAKMETTKEQNFKTNDGYNLEKASKQNQCDNVKTIPFHDQSENTSSSIGGEFCRYYHKRLICDDDDEGNYSNNQDEFHRDRQYDNKHKSDDHHNQIDDCISRLDDYRYENQKQLDSDHRDEVYCVGKNQSSLDENLEEYNDNLESNKLNEQLNEKSDDKQQRLQTSPHHHHSSYHDCGSGIQTNGHEISLRLIEDANEANNGGDHTVEIIGIDDNDHKVNFYTFHIQDSVATQEEAIIVQLPTKPSPQELEATIVAGNQISFCEIEELNENDDDDDYDRYECLNKINKYKRHKYCQDVRDSGDEANESKDQMINAIDPYGKDSVVDDVNDEDNINDDADYEELSRTKVDSEVFVEINGDEQIDISLIQQEQEFNEPLKIANATTTILRSEKLADKEIITYQRFGRSSRHMLVGCSFKCHLCGFSCSFKQTLLQHFRQIHPT